MLLASSNDAPQHWAQAIGPATWILVRHQLESKPQPEMGYRACLGVLALARKYGRERYSPFPDGVWIRVDDVPRSR